jgi:hypothetical protein
MKMLTRLEESFKPIKATYSSYPLTQSTPTKFQIAIWGGLIITTLVLSLIKFNTFQVGTYIDDANYVILGESFISSPYYGLFNEPIQNKQSQFPLGFPLLLSVSAFLFPGNLDVMKAYSLIATLLNISILFWGWRLLSHMDSHWMGLVVAGMYSVFPLVIQQSTMVMSEPVFLTFYLLALVLTEQAARNDEKRWWVFAMGIVIFFLGFTRTIGVILILSVFAYLLLVRGLSFWKQLTGVIAGVVILTSFVIWLTPITPTDLLPAEYFRSRNANIIAKVSSIFSPVLKPNGLPAESIGSDVLPENNNTPPQAAQQETRGKNLNIRTFLQGVGLHFRQDLRQVIVPIGLGEGKTLANILSLRDILNLLGYLISGLVFLGFFRLFARKKLSIFILSAFVYLAALMLWVWNAPRLLYPILPQMQFCFLIGLGGIISLFTSSPRFPFLYNRSNLFLAAAVIVLGLVSTYKSLRIDNSYIHAGDMQARTEWLRTNVESTASIMTEYPEVDYIYMDHKTIQYPSSDQITSSDALETYLQRNRVNYILVAPQISWQFSYSPSYSRNVKNILPFIEDLARKNELTLVHISKPNLIRVYKRPN